MINSMPTGKAKFKPYVEESDSYLKPGMKDEPEGRAIPKKMPAGRPMPTAPRMGELKKKAPAASKKGALIKQLGKITKKP